MKHNTHNAYNVFFRESDGPGKLDVDVHVHAGAETPVADYQRPGCQWLRSVARVGGWARW